MFLMRSQRLSCLLHGHPSWGHPCGLCGHGMRPVFWSPLYSGPDRSSQSSLRPPATERTWLRTYTSRLIPCGASSDNRALYASILTYFPRSSVSKKEKSTISFLHLNPYVSHRLTQASQNERAWAVVPKYAKYSLGTSYTS